MCVRRHWVAAFAMTTTAWAGIASAQTTALTLEAALSRAREQAPEIVSARLAIDEARARLIGSAVRFPQNPEVTAGLGNRNGTEGRSTDLELGVSQLFEPSSRRVARRAGAEAAIAERTADLDEVTRLVLAQTAAAFYRAVHEGERVRLLTSAEQLATSILEIADRRFRAGDIAVLDVNLSKGALARVRAQREQARAAQQSAMGELKTLLGLEGDYVPQGSLASPSSLPLESLLTSAEQRPILRSLEAAAREAEAEARLGKSFGKPGYGFGLRYGREERANIVFGEVTLSLPVFAKGQELLASGTAREQRLRAELEAARTRVRIEVVTSLAEYDRHREAVRWFESDALPGLDENETLATRSFEVGQLGLPELLLIRREILDTRFDYLQALLEAALARVTLDARASVLK
jgi:outer membrane protein, heavy metal efflux system